MNQPTVKSPLINLWDEDQQKEVDVPLQQAQTSLFDQGSSLGLVPGKKYYFRGEDGGLFETDNAQDIFDNIKAGYTPVSSGLAEKEKFADTIPGQIATAGLSALKGYTAGLSDVGIISGAKALEPFLPGATQSTRDTLNALYDTNRYTSAIGNVAGTVGGFFGPGSVIKGISALGQATQSTKLVAGLANLASKAPIIGGAGSGAVKLGAGSAVEGSLFAVGQTLSEYDLGKTDDVAESLLANAKNNAIVGGAIGGGLGAIGGAAKSTLGGLFANKTAKPAAQTTEQVTDELAAQAQGVLKPIQITSVADEVGVLPGAAGTKTAPVPPVTPPGIPPVQEPLPSTAKEFIDRFGKKVVDVTGNMKNFSAADQAALEQVFNKGNLAREALLDPKKFKAAVYDDIAQAATQLDDNAITASKGLNEAIDAFEPDINSSLQAINNIDTKLQTLRKNIEAKPSEYQARQLQILDLTERRLASLVDTTKPEGLSTTRNVFKDLREYKQELFSDTTAGLKSANRLSTGSDTNAAKVYDEIYDAINTNLKDEKLFGDVGKSLAEMDMAHRVRLQIQQDLRKAGVLTKDNRGYVVNDRAAQRMLTDERKQNLFQDLLDSDFQFKQAASNLEASTGIKLNLGDITPRASERARAYNLVQELFRNELTTGKSAIMGDIIGAVGGTLVGGPLGGAAGYAAARAIGHAIENPGLLVQRLVQLSDSAERLGAAAAGIKEATGMLSSLEPIAKNIAATGTATKFGLQDTISNIAKQMNAEDNLEVIRYMQMKDAEKATQQTNKAVNDAANGLLKKNPPTDIGPQSFNRVKPLTPEGFIDLQSKLLTSEDVGQNVQQAMGETMPMVSQSLAAKANEARNFLVTKLPPLIPDELGIEKAVPDPQALAKFSRYVDAVDSPFGVLKNLQQGYVTQEGMETLRTVYPALWASLQEQVKAGLTDTPSPKQRQLLAEVLNGQSQVAMEGGMFAQGVWSGALEAEQNKQAPGAPGMASQPSPGASGYKKTKVSVAASQAPSRRGALV